MLITLPRWARKARIAVMLAGLVACVSMVLTALQAPAANASQGACRGPMWGFLQQDICVVAEMGGKNHSAHTQWIGWVESNQPTGVYGYLQVWGDGFYHSAHGVNKRWYINKWLRSGTNVCAAETDPYGEREIACISIHV